MENAARNEIEPRDPAPWVMPTTTLGAFGGALALYRFGPVGVLAAGALLFGWVAVVLIVAERQQRRNLVSGAIRESGPRKPSRIARVPQILLMSGAAVALVYAGWLERHGAPHAATQPWSNAAMLLVLLAGAFAVVTDGIELWLNRFRLSQAKG